MSPHVHVLSVPADTSIHFDDMPSAPYPAHATAGAGAHAQDGCLKSEAGSACSTPIARSTPSAAVRMRTCSNAALALRYFMESGRYSDAKLRLDNGRVFSVHRIILGAQSKTLDKIVSGARPHGSPVEVNLGAPSLDDAFPLLLNYLYGIPIEIEDSNVVPLYLLSLDLEIQSLKDSTLEAVRAILEASPPKAAVLLRQIARTRPPHAHHASPLHRDDALVAACVAAACRREGSEVGEAKLRRALFAIAGDSDLCQFLEHLRTIEEHLQSGSRTRPTPLCETVRRKVGKTASRGRDPKRLRRGEGVLFTLEEEGDDEASELELKTDVDLDSADEEDARLLDDFARHMKIGPSRAVAIPRRARPADFNFEI